MLRSFAVALILTIAENASADESPPRKVSAEVSLVAAKAMFPVLHRLGDCRLAAVNQIPFVPTRDRERSAAEQTRSNSAKSGALRDRGPFSAAANTRRVRL